MPKTKWDALNNKISPKKPPQLEEVIYMPVGGWGVIKRLERWT